ncbi:hypothetical protein SCHPADRAFT_932557 [Schizopora paradoxa]|uniref:F-box domain-containing protein n=1 Tax=Schizopora paradoxa TaxID=27342 RepID=A0A0H2R640_9AGAM|nr:hypothetical protein SCHPADRAFT_932557 [Schizopora paradoxa]
MGMGWRKVGDDRQELCRLLDYLLGGVQTLKSSVQSGRRLGGEGEMKVDLKELWYSGSYRHRAGDSNHPTIQETQMALRQMKDAKSLLSTISKSLDEAIQTITDDTFDDCRAAGFSLLPDDLLTYIFEMHVEDSVSSEQYMFYNRAPRNLASVSKHFRRVALAHSGIWKHNSLGDSRESLLLYKERCPNPIIHIHKSDDIPSAEADKLHMYPSQQWRGLRITYRDKEDGHLYFRDLNPIIETPLAALEDLMICNDNMFARRDEFGQLIPRSIHLDGDSLRTLSSWQMPKLTHLDLRNVLPLAPLQCGNVTSLTVNVKTYCGQSEDLNVVAFRNLLQSMPKIQSLHIALRDMDRTFNETSSDPVSLPDLTSLRFEVGGTTSNLVINQIMELVDTSTLTRLTLKFFLIGEHVLDGCVSAIFDRKSSTSRVGHIAFMKVEEFSLEVTSFRISDGTFISMFSAIPNAHTISLELPENVELPFADIPKKLGVLQRLRSLHIKFPRRLTDYYTNHLINLNRFFKNGNCKELEKLEVDYQRPVYATMAKAHLREMLGERVYLMDD